MYTKSWGSASQQGRQNSLVDSESSTLQQCTKKERLACTSWYDNIVAECFVGWAGGYHKILFRSTQRLKKEQTAPSKCSFLHTICVGA